MENFPEKHAKCSGVVLARNMIIRSPKNLKWNIVKYSFRILSEIPVREFYFRVMRVQDQLRSSQVDFIE